MKLDKSLHIYGLFCNSVTSRIILTVFLALISLTIDAKESYESPDFMRSTGKIYVVAAVCFIILITLLIYLIILDRKITRLEKRQKNE